MDRALSVIAREIKANWKNVNYAAKPYLDAMLDLNKLTDKYYLDDGDDIVIRFLGNAQTWRGPRAKEIKAELNKMLKEHRKQNA